MDLFTEKEIFDIICVVRRCTSQTQSLQVSLHTHRLRVLVVEGREKQWAWLVLLNMARVICPGGLCFVGVQEMLRGLAGVMLPGRNSCMWLGWGLGRRDRLDVWGWARLFWDILLWLS